MPFLIDGYNVYHAAIKMRNEWSHIVPQKLCQLVADDMHCMGDHAVLVFDGRPLRGQTVDNFDADCIRVLYSGPDQDADSLLEKLIKKTTAPRRLIVVSSDRVLRRAARRRRAVSLGAADYLSQLLQRAQHTPARPSEPQQKHQGLGKDELDSWLELFDLDLDSNHTGGKPPMTN